MIKFSFIYLLEVRTQTSNVIAIKSRSDLSKILTSLHTSLLSGWFLTVKN